MRSCKLLVLCVLISSALLAGCASRASFVYKPSPSVAAGMQKLPLKVAVTHFDDLRGDDNTNASFIYLIPLVPFGTISYDRPDGANGFLFHASYNFRPSEDFARAVVEELKQNNYFDEVFVTQRQNEPAVDLIISGKIKEAKYNGKLISYGLSAYGPMLWFVGLPAGTTHNAINLSLEMRRASDNVVVWTHDIKGEWDKTVGMYYNWAADFDGYPVILSEGLHEGMKKLSNDLKGKDITYWKGGKQL